MATNDQTSVRLNMRAVSNSLEIGLKRSDRGKSFAVIAGLPRVIRAFAKMGERTMRAYKGADEEVVSDVVAWVQRQEYTCLRLGCDVTETQGVVTDSTIYEIIIFW